MDEAERYEFEETIKELESYRGRHTELISVLIPDGFSIHQVAKQIEDEKGTATNIKSNSTRKNVLDALEKISRQLKNFGPTTPQNGLALYAGNVSEVEGKEDIRVWTIIPPKPLKVRAYRCDQTFLIEPLKEMIESDDVYGLILIDRKEATIGLLEGKSIKLIDTLTSGIPSKFKTGGQSAQRFHRIREGMAKEFFRRVAEAAKKAFFDIKNLKGILVGGPIPTKEEFLQEGDLVTALKEKVIAVKDIGEDGMPGLKALVDACEDVLQEQEVIKQKKILDEFFRGLNKNQDKIAYGEKEVEQRLIEGAVEKLILSKTALPREKIHHFEELAKNISAEIHLVSNETAEGVQFDNLGGIGGILRYSVYN
ncbi:MAG: peptide chain release factor aRF-1 [Candidatus Pacearchaeota archaeon]